MPTPVGIPQAPYPSVAAPRSFKLRDLHAQFMRVDLRIETWKRLKTSAPDRGPGEYLDEDFEPFTGPREYTIPVETLAEAHGIWFDCPLCHAAGERHAVSVGFAGRAPPGTMSRDDTGKDSRWQIAGGTGLDDLQLSPSIWLKSRGGCGWHGFVGWAGVPAGEAR